MQICRGFTERQWSKLNTRLHVNDEPVDDEALWYCAVTVFERRIRERFFSCIELLEMADPKIDVEVPDDAPSDCSTLPKEAGVTVPRICHHGPLLCTYRYLSSFRRKPQQLGSEGTNDAFRESLYCPAFKDAFVDDGIAASFAKGVRNGLLHEAETRKWVIWRQEPEGVILVREDSGYALNRSEFCRCLRIEFDSYLRELRDPKQIELRKRFLQKMKDIVRERSS